MKKLDDRKELTADALTDMATKFLKEGGDGYDKAMLITKNLPKGIPCRTTGSKVFPVNVAQSIDLVVNDSLEEGEAYFITRKSRIDCGPIEPVFKVSDSKDYRHRFIDVMNEALVPDFRGVLVPNISLDVTPEVVVKEEFSVLVFLRYELFVLFLVIWSFVMFNVCLTALEFHAGGF